MSGSKARLDASEQARHVGTSVTISCGFPSLDETRHRLLLHISAPRTYALRRGGFAEEHAQQIVSIGSGRVSLSSGSPAMMSVNKAEKATLMSIVGSRKV